MRRLLPYVAFGLTLFAIGLCVLIPLLSCRPTHPASPARFVQEVPMPNHTRIYPVAAHGCGGENLPADRETRMRVCAEKGVRP